MSANTVENRQNFGTASNGRQCSPNIWADYPANDVNENPALGTHLYEDFLRLGNITTPTITTEATYTGGWKAFGSTGATMLTGGLVGGGFAIFNDDDNEAAAIMQIQLPYKLIIGGGDFWFETRIKTSSVTVNDRNVFVGLGSQQTLAVGVPFTAANPPVLVTTNNYVGFFSKEAAATQFDTTYQADTVAPVVVKSNALPTALAADTFVKLGMRYRNSDRKLRFFVNNIELIDNKTLPTAAGTDFPNDVLMGILIATQMGSNTDQTLTVDWVRAAQLTVL